MANNKYYILNLPEQALEAVLKDSDIVERPDTVRYNLNGTKCVVKARLEVVGTPAVLPNGLNEYTHSEILIEMAKAEWSTQE